MPCAMMMMMMMMMRKKNVNTKDSGTKYRNTDRCIYSAR